MLSELILKDRRDNVSLVPIVPEVSRTLAIAIKADKIISPALKRLIAITKEFAKSYNSQSFGEFE